MEKVNSRSRAEKAIIDKMAMIDAKEGFGHTKYDRSGDLELPLYTFPPGSHVTRAAVCVMGDVFSGKLKFLKGAMVTASPIIYGAEGRLVESPSEGEQAFVVDFGGIRSILCIYLESGTLTLVLPWMGTQFAENAVYHVGSQFVPVETTKLLVQIRDAGALDFFENCHIITNTYPNNLKASLNGRLPFWSHPGVLSEQVQIKGLEEDLNALLKEAKEETKVTLHLTTDNPGVLSVIFDIKKDLDFELSGKARWGNASTLDVSLQALEEQEVVLFFPTSGTEAWKIRRLALDIKEKFPVWMAHSGQTDMGPGKIGMKISAQFSVARRFVFEEGGELYGLAIPFKSISDKAELRIEVATEEKGKPSSNRTLGKADLSLSSETASTSCWTDLLFPSPIKIEPGKGIWLVVKAKKGAVEWVGSVEPASSDTTTLFNNEGALWQSYPFVNRNCPIAQIRVLRRPFMKENEPLLGITWNWKDNEKFQKFISNFMDTINVEFALAPDKYQEMSPREGVILVPLVMNAKSSGTVTIKGATAFRSI